MLCSSCGEKIRFKKGVFICDKCDTEFNLFDIYKCLIPEPVFVTIKLNSQYAIIDTRKQEVYLRVDTIAKAQLIAELLDKDLAQKTINRHVNKYLGRE